MRCGCRLPESKKAACTFGKQSAGCFFHLVETPSEKDKPKPNHTAKLSYKEQRELDALPDEITALETEQANLNAQLSAPEIFKDYEKAGSLQARAEEIETLLPKNHSSKNKSCPP